MKIILKIINSEYWISFFFKNISKAYVFGFSLRYIAQKLTYIRSGTSWQRAMHHQGNSKYCFGLKTFPLQSAYLIAKCNFQQSFHFRSFCTSEYIQWNLLIFLFHSILKLFLNQDLNFISIKPKSLVKNSWGEYNRAT